MSTTVVRRGLLALTIGGAVLLTGLALLFWRVLPPIVPPGAGSHANERPYAGIPVLPTALPRASVNGVRVAILVEPENVRVTAPGAYARGNALWREWLIDIGAEIVQPGQADVLVAAQTRCLGPVQRRIIAAHLAKGGGIVTTGALGAYDGVCKPLADTLLASLLGIRDEDIRAAPRRKDDAHYAVVLGETVLGANMPPGPRLEFRPDGEIAFKVASREMLYCDYERRPMNAGQPYFDAAAARALVGPGRIAAFGFSPVDLVGDWSRDIGRVIVANAVRWAAGRATFQLAPWPNGKKAAAVMSQDVEADFQNARISLDALEKYNLPGTAFIVGKLAQADPETTRRLIARMEIGTHTQRHLPLDTLTPAAEVAELAESKRVAERLLGKPVLGFRPPEERFDSTTLQTWADLGGSYVFVNNNMRSAGPEIIPLLPDSLVMLGRVSEDDFEILNRDKIRDRRQMSGAIISQVNESVAYRGLYMFSYHSHMFSQKELVPVLQALAEKLRSTPEVWTTTAGEVADWWRRRWHVELSTDGNGAKALLRNDGPTPFAGGVLLVDLPRGERRSIRLPVLQPGAAIWVDAAGRITPVASHESASQAVDRQAND